MPYHWAGQRGRMGLFWRVHPSCRWPARASHEDYCSAHFVSCYRCSYVRHRLEQVVRRSNLQTTIDNDVVAISKTNQLNGIAHQDGQYFPFIGGQTAQFIYAGQRQSQRHVVHRSIVCWFPSVSQAIVCSRTWIQTTITIRIALRYVRPLIRSIATR